MSELHTIINELITEMAQAVPGPYGVSYSDTDSHAAMVAYYERATAPHASTILWQVHTEQVSPSGLPLALCITGNGPKAETHARVLAASLTAVPILLSIFKQTALDIEAAIAALGAGDTESALRLLTAIVEESA